MANIPCPIKNPCPEDGPPVTDFDSHKPDAKIFIGRNSYNQMYPPNPGQNWVGDATFGPTSCASEVSQQEADLCAGRNGPTDPGNSSTTPTSNPPNDTLPHTPPGPIPIFYSHSASCTVTCPDGSLYTYTVAAGAFVNRSQILADRAANSLACANARRFRICFGSMSSNCCISQPFSATLSVSGMSNVVAVTVGSGALPDGLALSYTPGAGAAIISGTPTVGGNFSFTIQATDTFGNHVTKTFSLCVISILPTLLPSAMQGTAYFVQLSTSCGTVSEWDVFGGEFPEGLTLDTETGVIQGTPTESGTFNFTIEATVGEITCDRDYSLTVAALPTGWKICDWISALSQLVGLGPCGASALPAWNGIFNLNTTTNLTPGDILWYFINQSASASKVAASEAPDYPGGNWQANDCFTQLFYSAASGTWSLLILCADNCAANTIWSGSITNHNPNDPSGVYINDGSGTSASPGFLTVAANTVKCCPQWGQLSWGVPAPANVGAGTSSFTPNNATGATFHSIADAPNGSVDTGSITNIGTLHYAGDNCNCNCHIAFSKIVTPGTQLGFAGGDVKLEYVVDGGPSFVLFDQNLAPTLVAVGTIDLPFNIFTQFGITSPGAFKVTTSATCPPNPHAGHQAIDVVTTFSNV